MSRIEIKDPTWTVIEQFKQAIESDMPLRLRSVVFDVKDKVLVIELYGLPEAPEFQEGPKDDALRKIRCEE